nr:ribose-5-phosphate isomerase [Micromonospora sp. DSM 115978]
MRVHLGSDHAGFHLKAELLVRLADLGHATVDHGPESYDPDDDYPPFVMAAAAAVAAESGSVGIVIGGSGNGEAIAANKVAGVRAALAWSEQTATLARQHNDANVLSLGARMHTVDEAVGFVEVFLTTPFSGEQRHVRRITMLNTYERTGVLPTPA